MAEDLIPDSYKYIIPCLMKSVDNETRYFNLWVPKPVDKEGHCILQSFSHSKKCCKQRSQPVTISAIHTFASDWDQFLI